MYLILEAGHNNLFLVVGRGPKRPESLGTPSFVLRPGPPRKSSHRLLNFYQIWVTGSTCLKGLAVSGDSVPLVAVPSAQRYQP